jgi:hypothetical protein
VEIRLSDESLGSILSDDEAPEEEAAEKSVPAPEASTAGETPAAKLDATESETDEIDAEEPDELGDLRYSGLKKAARKERKIRRAAEKQAKDLQRQIDQLNAHMQVRQQYQSQQHHQQQPATPVPPKEDDRFDRLLGKDGFKVIEDLVEERFSARDRAAEALEEKKTAARAYASRQKLLSEDPGAAEDIDVVFRQLAQQDPRLERQALASEDPARWAVQYAREVRRIQQYGSIDELVEAEIAKRAAAQSSESSVPEVQVRPQHKTIAGVRGSGSSSRHSGPDQDSLRDILS